MSKETFRQQLLTAPQTTRKIRRMAYQIYEQNFEETELIVAGIAGEGYRLAELLAAEVRQISPQTVTLARVAFDKQASSQPDITIESEVDSFRNKTVILVDDVLNTGRTLAFCMKPFMSIPLRKLQVVVLVDRGHHLFPIHADYVGYRLSTTLNEHIKVQLTDTAATGVYLY